MKIRIRLCGCVAYAVKQPNLSVRGFVGFVLPWLR